MITDLYKYIHVNVAINAQGVCILFGTSLQRAPQTSLSVTALQWSFANCHWALRPLSTHCSQIVTILCTNPKVSPSYQTHHGCSRKFKELSNTKVLSASSLLFTEVTLLIDVIGNTEDRKSSIHFHDGRSGKEAVQRLPRGFVWDYPHHKVLRAKFLSSWLSVSKVIIELIKVPGINPSRYQSSSHQSLPFSNASDGPLGLLSYSRTLHHELSFTNSLHALSSLHLLAVLYVSWRMGDVAQHG